MKKISIVIPLIEKNSKIERSLEYIRKQDLSSIECEIIIVNSCADYAEVCERVGTITQDLVRFLVVDVTEKTTKPEMLNKGMDCSSGDYIMFMRPGDAINPRLFRVLADILSDIEPEMISYGMTYAHDKFDMFDDDPFSNKEFVLAGRDDRAAKTAYLMNSSISECYLCHVYRKSLLEDVGIRFSSTLFDEDIAFAYPLMLLAESAVYSGEHGYCLFEDREKEDITNRITKRMAEQAKLFEMLCATSEVYDMYKEEVDAHFIMEYYLKNLKLARASGIEDKLKLSAFEVMQYVTLKLVPKWIENDYVFSLSRDDRSLMLLLNRHFDSENELDEELKKNKLVTVITTTYNRCEKIRESIECILNQSWQYFEYLIVDDGSVDSTESVVKEFGDSRIKFIKNSENRGLCFSRNVGIKNSVGNYIVCQDDDDFCRLDRLQKEMEYFLKLPDEYGMVYCESINHGRKLAGLESEDALIIPSREMSDVRKSGDIFPALLPRNFITATAGMFRRRCIDEVGMYDEELFGYEDWDIYLRISKKYEVGFVKEPLYDYYQRPGTLISNKDPEHRNKIIKSLYDIDNKFVEDRKLYGIETSFKLK